MSSTRLLEENFAVYSVSLYCLQCNRHYITACMQGSGNEGRFRYES